MINFNENYIYSKMAFKKKCNSNISFIKNGGDKYD